MTGTPLGDGEHNYHSKRKLFPLPNPDKLSMRELWGKSGPNTYEGYFGNESATKSIKYCRYALIVWPCASDLDLCFKHIGVDTVVMSFQTNSQRPLTVKALTTFMKRVEQRNRYGSLSEFFAATIMELLVETGDGATAREYCSHGLLHARMLLTNCLAPQFQYALLSTLETRQEPLLQCTVQDARRQATNRKCSSCVAIIILPS
ncbi:hypothetical protein FI667_g12713, partial [Globisporangium splendens]